LVILDGNYIAVFWVHDIKFTAVQSIDKEYKKKQKASLNGNTLSSMIHQYPDWK